MVNSTKPHVIFISKIKSYKIKSSYLNARFNMCNSFVGPLKDVRVGYGLMWNDDLQVIAHSSSFYVILATVVHSTSNQKFGLVCIYGEPYYRQNRQVWDEMATFVYENSNLHMLCIGP
jgi:hypothetical protein